MKRPQIGAKGLIYVKCNEDGSFKSSVDKFFDQKELSLWAEKCNASKGDLLLVLSGKTTEVQNQMNELRLKMGTDLGLCDPKTYKPMGIGYYLKKMKKLGTSLQCTILLPPQKMKTFVLLLIQKSKSQYFDLAINGLVGGGSIRIRQKC